MKMATLCYRPTRASCAYNMLICTTLAIDLFYKVVSDKSIGGESMCSWPAAVSPPMHQIRAVDYNWSLFDLHVGLQQRIQYAMNTTRKK
jgi:hypothetical protein